MLRFTPAQRLVQKSQFDTVYKQGCRIADAYFVILARPNEVGFPRLGLSVSARAVGCAVNRNRVKRIVRESFRLRQGLLPAIDIVVNARSAARDASKQMLADKLARRWQEVIKQCAQS